MLWVGRMHWKDLPSGSKVGTSSVLQPTADLFKYVPMLPSSISVVAINERLQLVKGSKVDGVIVALCALKRLKLDTEIKDIFPWEGMPLQGQLAVVGRQEDHELENLFSTIDVRRKYGNVTLVGAGPGDPELITLKGIKALAQADCVFYDYLADPSLLEHATQAEHIYAGKRKGKHSLSQEDLSRLLKEKAITGKKVVRLKGGDPLIFGRGADEIQYLRSYHIDVKIIPGISSATGIPSSLGIPLTARGISSSVAFLSGHEENDETTNHKLVAIPQADTLVFLMGLTKLRIIIESLQKSGWSTATPIMNISNGTKPQAPIANGTLSTLEELVKTHDVKPPALIIVGNSIDLYRPVHKKTFLHCGTHPDLYKHLGKIVHWPMIDIQPMAFNESQQKHFLQSFESAEIIVCTSWYGGECFFKKTSFS